MSDNENRDITISEGKTDTSHLAEPLSLLMDAIERAYSENMHNDAELRKERLEMFYEARFEYKISQKSRLFLGATTEKKIMEEADDYALRRVKKVHGEISRTKDEHIDRYIKLVERVSPGLLNTIVTVFERKRNGSRPKLAPGKSNEPDFSDILNFEAGGENDKEPVKRERRRFGKDFEEDSCDFL